MNWKDLSIRFVGLILGFVSSLWGYNLGANIECPYGFNSCIGHLGGMVGMLSVMVCWGLIFVIWIVFFKKVGKEKKTE